MDWCEFKTKPIGGGGQLFRLFVFQIILVWLIYFLFKFDETDFLFLLHWNVKTQEIAFYLPKIKELSEIRIQNALVEIRRPHWFKYHEAIIWGITCVSKIAWFRQIHSRQSTYQETQQLRNFDLYLKMLLSNLSSVVKCVMRVHWTLFKRDRRERGGEGGRGGEEERENISSQIRSEQIIYA